MDSFKVHYSIWYMLTFAILSESLIIGIIYENFCNVIKKNELLYYIELIFYIALFIFVTCVIIYSAVFRIYVDNENIKIRTAFSTKEYKFSDITKVHIVKLIPVKLKNEDYYKIWFDKKHYSFYQEMKNSKRLMTLLRDKGCHIIEVEG